jgi:HK97 family phage major capsid protein
MAMSVAEARSEIKKMFDEADLIEKKYPDGLITNAEDEKQVKTLLLTIDELESKLSGLEAAEARRNMIFAGMERYSKPAPGSIHPNPLVQEIHEGMTISPGDQFISDRAYREMKNSGVFNSSLSRVEFNVQLKDGTSLMQWRKKLEYEQKVLMTGASETSGGAFIHNDVRPGYLGLATRELSLLDLIPRVSTDSDTIEYVSETTFTNNAAFVTEATATAGAKGLKPQSALAYEVCTSPVRTLAHYIPVTNRMLADAPAIRGIINGRLLYGLDYALEAEIVTGSLTGEHFNGFLTTVTNFQGKGTNSSIDALFLGITKVTTGGGRANAIVLNPADWEQVRLAREAASTATSAAATGGYLLGPPNTAGAPTLWGLPVIISAGLTVGSGLVGDFTQGCMLFDREQAAIRVGTINDQFIRNMQTILAELRAAFVIWRPLMFTRVTGI